MNIGAGKSGGIYIGRDIQSELHSHHLIALVLSLGAPFTIIHGDGDTATAHAVLIPKDTPYELSTSVSDYTVFAHYDPYSQLGISLSQSTGLKILNHENFMPMFKLIQNWMALKNGSPGQTESLLLEFEKVMTTTEFSPHRIDKRISQVIDFVVNTDLENITTRKVAESIFLSQSRFSHLFKQETGSTFRKFLQHQKLVRSLQSLHTEKNFTEVAEEGGFTDQSHFIKIFKKNFGIKPSSSINKG